MVKVQSSKIQLISKFLNSQADLKNIKDIETILELPPDFLKFFNENDLRSIRELFDFSKISQFSELNPANPFEHLYFSDEARNRINLILKENPKFDEKLKKAITVSILINSLNDKGLSLDKKKQKVLVIGLDNAGKTAIITKLGGKFGIEDLASLKPTKGLERREVKTKDMNLLIWDFGGHELYRERNLLSEENFYGADLLLYVIDVQDPERLDDSFIYFRNIIELLDRIEEKTNIIILIHKYDPDLRKSPDISLRIEFIIDQIEQLFKTKDFNFDIYLSSIFSSLSNEPQFSALIKNILNDPDSFIYDQELTSTKIKSLGETIKKTLNAIIRLSEYCGQLEDRIISLEANKNAANTYTINGPLPIRQTPPSPPPSPGDQSVNQGVKKPGARTAVLIELKEVFAKRRELDRY